MAKPDNILDKSDLTTTQKQNLLRHARQSVAASCNPDGAKADCEIDDFPSHGAFVTLHKKGQLRGCIGTFASSDSTLDTLQEMAAAASQRDPRFPALSAAELEDIDLEISLLTPLQELTDIATIEVGRHGLCISRGWQRGVLLPQVATENNWDRETFLQHTCRKAGLPPDAWRQADTRIETFAALVFGENDLGE